MAVAWKRVVSSLESEESRLTTELKQVRQMLRLARLSGNGTSLALRRKHLNGNHGGRRKKLTEKKVARLKKAYEFGGRGWAAKQLKVSPTAVDRYAKEGKWKIGQLPKDYQLVR